MEKGRVTGSCRENTTQAGSRSRGIKCDKELKKVKTPIKFQMAMPLYRNPEGNHSIR